MRYLDFSIGSAYLPKLMGIYERELGRVIEEIVANAPARVIDVGAAEGYYAVGLAVRLGHAEIVAFETERRGQDAIMQLARLNNVSEKVQVLGKCEREDLLKWPADILICDVEGYELYLLDNSEAFQHVSILVELHEFAVPGITDILIKRFEFTHSIEQIFHEPRTMVDFPWKTVLTRILPKYYLNWAVSEKRPPGMSWLWMRPRISKRKMECLNI
jgi:hypothetical protein